MCCILGCVVGGALDEAPSCVAVQSSGCVVVLLTAGPATARRRSAVPAHQRHHRAAQGVRSPCTAAPACRLSGHRRPSAPPDPASRITHHFSPMSHAPQGVPLSQGNLAASLANIVQARAGARSPVATLAGLRHLVLARIGTPLDAVATLAS